MDLNVAEGKLIVPSVKNIIKVKNVSFMRYVKVLNDCEAVPVELQSGGSKW